jgi:hypothetical protein
MEVPRGSWFLALVLALAPQSAPAQDVWAFVGVGLPAAARFEVLLMGFALGDTDLKGGLVEARYRVTRWLSMAPGFLLTHRPIAGGSVSERRQRLDLTLLAQTGKVRLAARTLLELRHYRTELDDGTLRWNRVSMLRFRARCDLPLGRAMALLAPFVTVEPFYDLTAGRWHRVWTSAGVSLDLGDGVRLEPYYLRRMERFGPDGGAVGLSVVWRP